METRPQVFIAFAIILVFFFSSTLSAQIDSANPDYETLFKNNLRRGFLNLSGKKIGDKGLRILLKQKFISDLRAKPFEAVTSYFILG